MEAPHVSVPSLHPLLLSAHLHIRRPVLSAPRVVMSPRPPALITQVTGLVNVEAVQARTQPGELAHNPSNFTTNKNCELGLGLGLQKLCNVFFVLLSF